MSAKPVVHYLRRADTYIPVGSSALVTPVDHYADGERSIENGRPVRTSTVLKHDPATGRFETRNTIYEEATA